MSKYERLTHELEHSILADIINERLNEPHFDVLSDEFKNIYSELREEFNNAILDKYSEEKPVKDLAYDDMSHEYEKKLLTDIVKEEGANILSIGNIYSELREVFNNKILDRYEMMIEKEQEIINDVLDDFMDKHDHSFHMAIESGNMKSLIEQEFGEQIKDWYIEDMEQKYKSYENVLEDFEKNILPEVIKNTSENDYPAIRETWKMYTDCLCKDGVISDFSYNNWIYKPEDPNFNLRYPDNQKVCDTDSLQADTIVNFIEENGYDIFENEKIKTEFKRIFADEIKAKEKESETIKPS